MSPWKLPSIHFGLMYSDFLQEGRTVSDVSDDGGFKP